MRGKKSRLVRQNQKSKSSYSAGKSSEEIEMTAKKLFFAIWTGIAVGLIVLVCILTTMPESHESGHAFVVDGDNYIVVTGVADVVSAAGSEPFYIYNETADQFVLAQLDTKPLGWDDDWYFTAKLEKPSSGIWVVEDGTPTIVFEGGLVTEHVGPAAQIGRVFLTIMFGLMIYVVGLLMFVL